MPWLHALPIHLVLKGARRLQLVRDLQHEPPSSRHWHVLLYVVANATFECH